MIAVPWFKFPWTTQTADLAHDVATRAAAGDAGARGQLDAVKARADEGHKQARRAWAHFVQIIKLVELGQPPPSVIIQMRGVQVGRRHHGGRRGGGWGYPGGWWWPLEVVEVEYRDDEPPPKKRDAKVGFNGGFPGAVPTLPWGYQSIWNYGFDPFVFEEMGWGGDAQVGQNPAGIRLTYNYPPSWPEAVGQPLPGEIEYEYEVGQFGAFPGGVPLLPFGAGPFSFAPLDGGYMRGGPGMSEDIELADRYIG